MSIEKFNHFFHFTHLYIFFQEALLFQNASKFPKVSNIWISAVYIHSVPELMSSFMQSPPEFGYRHNSLSDFFFFVVLCSMSPLLGVFLGNTFCLSVAYFSIPSIMSFDEDIHNFDVVQFIRGFLLWLIYFI